MTITNEVVLAVDVGSSWCKAAYFDGSGNAVSTGETWVRDRQPFGHDAEALERVWQGVVGAVREANAGLGDRQTVALGIAARKAPGIWLDEAGAVVGLPAGVAASIGRQPIRACYASSVWGDDDPFAYGYGIDLIGNTRWLRDNRPQHFARVCRAGNLHSWLVYRLTGQWATSHAGGPVQQRWPEAVRELSGLSPDAYPAVFDDSQVIGTIAPEPAGDLGRPETTRVITGTHDGAAANIGAGALGPGDACLTFGTNGVMRIVTGERIPGRFGYTVTSGRWALVRDLPNLAPFSTASSPPQSIIPAR
ncbi:MAG: FGGY family carbohydrate kinase [Thermomicrobiales bacterium]